MLPLIVFIVVMSLFLVSEFRWSGRLRGKNLLEAAAGFLGWFVLNTLLWVWVLEGESGTVIINPFRLIPLLVNLSLFLVLYLTRRRMAILGILAALVVNALGLLLFVPPGPIMDQRAGRVIAMLPFYLYFLFPGL